MFVILTGNHDAYISLTCHYIHNWKLCSINLACDPFPGSHTADLIAKKVLEVSGRNGIVEADICCLVTDNEPTMNAVGNLVSFEWHGCLDHLIELVTGVVFASKGVGDIMSQARTLVGFFQSSTQATETLCELQKIINPGQPALRVESDVVTRWWSTYTMLERLVVLRPHIETFHVSKKLKPFLDDDAWLICTYMVKALAPFMEIQTFFEGVEYVTISFVSVMVQVMRTIIANTLDEFKPVCSNRFRNALTSEEKEFEDVRAKVFTVANEMKAVFETRWGSGKPNTVFNEHKTHGYKNIRKGLPRLAMIASAVDPRTKALSGIPIEEHGLVWNEVKEEMKSEEKAADQSVLSRTTTTTSSSSLSCQSVFVERQQRKNIFAIALAGGEESRTDKTVDEIKDELQAYQRVKQIDAYDDPLTWWQHHENEFPLTSRLAKRLLCIPATSAPSERMFSSAGLVARKKRERLAPDTVSSLVFLKQNWNNAERKKVKVTHG